MRYNLFDNFTRRKEYERNIVKERNAGDHWCGTYHRNHCSSSGVFWKSCKYGFCIACFLRDTSGALGFHSAAAVQYIRPEIVGLVLGSCILALATKEFKPRGGSAPVTRFVIGMFVMIGCLMFLAAHSA